MKELVVLLKELVELQDEQIKDLEIMLEYKNRTIELLEERLTKHELLLKEALDYADQQKV